LPLSCSWAVERHGRVAAATPAGAAATGAAAVVASTGQRSANQQQQIILPILQITFFCIFFAFFFSFFFCSFAGGPAKEPKINQSAHKAKEGRKAGEGRGESGKAESRKSGKAGLSAEPEERSTLRLFDLPGRERGPGPIGGISWAAVPARPTVPQPKAGKSRRKATIIGARWPSQGKTRSHTDRQTLKAAHEDGA